MKYYIAVINQELHLKQWETLRSNLKKINAAYVVYYTENKEIELNEVTSDVFYSMLYCEN